MPHALPGDSVPHVAQEDRSRSGAGEPIPCHERKWKKRPARLHCRYMYVRVGASAGRDVSQLLRASDARFRVRGPNGLRFESLGVTVRTVYVVSNAPCWRLRACVGATCVKPHAPVWLPATTDFLRHGCRRATTVFLHQDDRGRRRAQDLGEWPLQQRLNAPARSDLRHADRAGVFAATFRHRLAAHRRCPSRFTLMAY